jgi:putative hydrolase of the HAD superfamily
VIRAVCFDAAGTLLAVREPVGETYARFARRAGIHAAADALEDGFQRAFRRAEPLAFPSAAPRKVRALEREWWWRRVSDAFRAAGVDPPRQAVASTFAAVFEHFASRAAWRLFPDVKPALRRLRARGLRLAVVSNFDTRLLALLEQLGVSAYFDAVVLSSMVGFAKPDPRLFAAALRSLRAAGATALHVGDSERLDRRAARAAGLRALRLDRGGRSTRHVIASLEELPNRVASDPCDAGAPDVPRRSARSRLRS